ncbi:aldehyde dehydrogenase [Vreelandella boliviensis]|uniref:Aldehyde dehydrogenase PuuC n=1 Tax=Vreelandella boliviensis LC1 TaxID=1072583 RepID=A0A265DTA3_9GAMM|nr:aldehyde dehydrogenase [Halomonas boliviensis]EHJ94844.1 Gamma-glutamyl-gamma-aminobutyraldehyde dehydrogenase [Halomonas boliviensis LC1]OZT72553.1 aldehyde dehydrogenase PuuC [Halomonas boliviensis LC1]
MTIHDKAYWQELASRLQPTTQAFINGEFVASRDGATLSAYNPATGQVLAEVTACGSVDIDRAVQAARRVFEAGDWSRCPPLERKNVLLRFASLIAAHAEELALLQTLEMGKPIADSLAFDLPETVRCVAWYAEAIDKQYDEIAPTGEDVHATITREPLGVVAAVVPWNFPLMIAAWKFAPALAMGNSIVLKPAEASSLSALRLAALAKEAGLPDGVFNVTPGHGAVAGEALGMHPQVDALAFTGSTATGKLFMRYSSESNLKRVWLECGGKSPHLVFADCPDLDAAAQAAAAAIFTNQGEVCIAGSRLYVEETIFDDFLPRLIAAARDMPAGDPLDPATRMGALVSAAHHAKVLNYIEQGLSEGMTLHHGGRHASPVEGGWYVEPTILEGGQTATSMREEIFGPVLGLGRFSSEAEAITLANDSIYGLGAGLWTSDLGRAHRVSKRLQAGLVWVNCYADGDISVPFGGVKQSGFGRDKSLHALDKYSDLKTTWFNLAYSR